MIERFQRAMERSLRYAQEHPAQARRAVLGYAEIDPQVAEEMVLPGWSASYNRDALARIASLALQFEILDEDVDLGRLVLEEEAP